MRNDIYAKGVFSYITDHGLTIGDSYEDHLNYPRSDNTPYAMTEKYTLLTEASKHSIDLDRPFELFFHICDRQDSGEQQFLYQALIQFQPISSSNNLTVNVNGMNDLLLSFSGNVAPVNAKLLLDNLLEDFLNMCEEFQRHSG